MGTQQSSTDRERYARETVEFARAFTFFDAVYAFALTLLAVEHSIRRALRTGRACAKLLGSGLEWQFVRLRRQLRRDRGVLARQPPDRRGFRALSPGTIVANLVAIAPSSVLIPFSTQGISDVGTADQPLAVAVYAVNISARRARPVGDVRCVARHDGVLADPLPRRADRSAPRRRPDRPPAIFLASIHASLTRGAPTQAAGLPALAPSWSAPLDRHGSRRGVWRAIVAEDAAARGIRSELIETAHPPESRAPRESVLA